MFQAFVFTSDYDDVMTNAVKRKLGVASILAMSGVAEPLGDISDAVKEEATEAKKACRFDFHVFLKMIKSLFHFVAPIILIPPLQCHGAGGKGGWWWWWFRLCLHQPGCRP